MFDIVTITPEDDAVEIAVDALMNRKAKIVSPTKGFRFVTHNSAQEIDGGGSEQILVIVGHGSPDSLSGCKTWAEYKSNVFKSVDCWSDKKSVYVVACSTDSNSNKFCYRNIADEIKESFSSATVWASSTPVNAGDLTGNWEKL